MENELNLNVTGNDKGVVTILHGDALPLREKEIVTITGTIKAPGIFIAKRAAHHEKEKVHVLYSIEDQKITLECDEDDYYGTTIIGKLESNKALTEFGINSKAVKYTVKSLISFLKLRKFYFADQDECLKIITNLQKFSAEVSTKINDADDSRGNKTKGIDITVKTDLALYFNLKMPIFKGFETKEFRVDVAFDIRDAACEIWLESMELEMLILSDREKLIKEELQHFDDYVVIEQ